MPSDQLRLRGNAAYLLLKSLGQAQVRLPATVAQQRSVGGILHQRVFEGIGGERWLTMRYNDSSLDQFAQSVLMGEARSPSLDVSPLCKTVLVSSSMKRGIPSACATMRSTTS